MALTREKVTGILLEELRAKGYSPNPSDVSVAVKRILDEQDIKPDEAPVVAPETEKAPDSQKPS